jgi:hypothetical protein
MRPVMEVRLNSHIARQSGKSGWQQGKDWDESTPLRGWKKVIDPSCQEKSRSAIRITLTVPQTDTGRWGENPKALVRTLVQELGKMYP